MRFAFNTKSTALWLWMCVIFLLSHQNGQDSSETSGILLELLEFIGIGPGSSVQGALSYLIRKAGHFTEYLILAILFLRYRKERGTSEKSALYAFLFVFLYASSDEFHQSFIPGRGPAFSDVLIDTAGGLTGIILYGWKQRMTERQKPIYCKK
ncbi:VanZ family protein [uncultured Trichococcus sp.]|uniref:VanZ family protein n=1 Tax=uncultured Trichococcus sp. TaxID=189665 RepID=UPI0029C8F77A|nr:VanZ family protein [uncultured Trichococcus sp.]